MTISWNVINLAFTAISLDFKYGTVLNFALFKMEKNSPLNSISLKTLIKFTEFYGLKHF